ncbi:cobalt ECF transporter T component CbiQ [bacterium]|nr:cobalt ECF transporter T component CbiQ [bacterium]
MRHDFFDRYSRRTSPVHRRPAALKLGAALAVIAITVTLPANAWAWFAALAATLALVVALSGIPPRYLLVRLLCWEPFIIGVALLSLWQPGGARVFAGVVVKSSLCLLTMILLANTTPFDALLGLLRRVRAPGLLVTTLALMYRYVFVLVDEAERMHRARISRTFSRRRRGLWQVLGTVIGQLFVRSTERAERIYAAMGARGWQ